MPKEDRQDISVRWEKREVNWLGAYEDRKRPIPCASNQGKTHSA